MKYKSFIRIVLLSIGVVVIGSVVLIAGCITLAVRSTKKPVESEAVSKSSDSGGIPGGTSGGVPGGVPGPIGGQSGRATTEELKKKIGDWLFLHSDRQGLMKKDDIMPGESFRATAIRFPQSDAAKWSNKDSQWSQIKIDLDRNGLDDEKWLLKNGELYKREVLDTGGKTTFMEYFQ